MPCATRSSRARPPMPIPTLHLKGAANACRSFTPSPLCAVSACADPVRLRTWTKRHRARYAATGALRRGRHTKRNRYTRCLPEIRAGRTPGTDMVGSLSFAAIVGLGGRSAGEKLFAVAGFAYSACAKRETARKNQQIAFPDF